MNMRALKVQHCSGGAGCALHSPKLRLTPLPVSQWAGRVHSFYMRVSARALSQTRALASPCPPCSRFVALPGPLAPTLDTRSLLNAFIFL